MAGTVVLACAPGAPLRPEHPRPDWVRASFVPLDGRWEFAFDPGDRGIDEGWFRPGAPPFPRRIEVPFPWESALSGVGPPPPATYTYLDARLHPTYRGAAWYRRSFSWEPGPPGERTDLVFGAVQWSARVWVNGREAGGHEGGFTPFRLDVTDLLQAGTNLLVVRAFDPSDLDREILVGKMGGLWYTRSSGPWQPVYLERHPSSFVEWAQVIPGASLEAASVRVAIHHGEGSAPLRIELRATGEGGDRFAGGQPGPRDPGDAVVEVPLALPGARPWTPAAPHLYRLEIELLAAGGSEDRVETTFGLRTVTTDWVAGHGPADNPDPADRYRGLLLNGRPLYVRGALDQGFNPWGLLAAPSAEAARADVDRALQMGLNALRIHGKLEDPEFLEEADRRGLLLFADLPFPDLAAPNSPGGRLRGILERTFEEAIERDFNHPALIAWTLFNEGWGLRQPQPIESDPELQAWLEGFVARTRAADPTRLIEDNSAGGAGPFHVDSDLDTWHFYSEDRAEIRRWLESLSGAAYPGSTSAPLGVGAWLSPRTGAPLLVSEFGGFDGLGVRHDVSRSLRTWVNEIRRLPKIQGWIVTELYDVEWEGNGLLHYDRTPKFFPFAEGARLGPPYDMAGDLFLGFDDPLDATAKAGETVVSTPFVSIPFVPPLPPGDLVEMDPTGGVRSAPLPALGRGVHPLAPMEAPVSSAPPGGGIALFEVAFASPTGATLASNLRQIALEPPPPPTEGGVSWPVTGWSAASWSGGGPSVDPDGTSVVGFGSGFFEYRVSLASLPGRGEAIVEIEAAPAAPLPLLQSDPLGAGSEVRLTLDGGGGGADPLPPPPADALGVFSWLEAPSLLGAYGVRLSKAFPWSAPPGPATAVVRIEVPPGGGGIRLFGAHSGRFGADPRLLLAPAAVGSN